MERECPDCGQTVSSASFARHRRTHTGTRTFICEFPHCGRAFGRKDALRLHQRFHLKDAVHPCPECGKAFVQLPDLRRHLTTHARKRERRNAAAVHDELAATQAILKALHEQNEAQQRRIEALERLVAATKSSAENSAAANQQHRDVCGCWKYCKPGSMPCAVGTLVQLSAPHGGPM